MRFVTLCTEEEVETAREQYPLFYDACLPYLPHPNLHGGLLLSASPRYPGLRHALVCDEESTVLAVLRQRFPYQTEPVTVVSLVLTRPVPGTARAC